MKPSADENILEEKSDKTKKRKRRISGKPKNQAIEKKEKGGMLRTRSSPKSLVDALKVITEEQKQAVRDIGLGSILELKIDKIPGKMGYFVVDRFDERTMELRLNNNLIQITKKSIHDMLGIPMDGSCIPRDDICKSGNQLIIEWRGRIGNEYARPSHILEAFKNDKVDTGRNFLLNFIVLFITCMAETNSMGLCNLKILPYLHEGVDLKKIDWCDYIFECLKNHKARWDIKDSDSYYAGPLTLLTLFYVDSTICDKVQVIRQRPALKSWDTTLLKRRQKKELRYGGFGFGKVEQPFEHEQAQRNKRVRYLTCGDATERCATSDGHGDLKVPVFDDFDNADDGVANGDSGSVNCSTEVTETVSLNLTNPIEDATPVIDKQTSIETTSMKRAKTTSLGSNTKSSKPSKKTKAMATSDDPSLANVGQSKEVDKSPVVDKTVDKTVGKSKIVTRGNKKPIEQGKSVELEQPKVTSARKKGKLSADNKEPEAIPKGAAGDSTTIMTPDIVEGEHASQIWPMPVIMGLQCIAMSASKKHKTTQSFAPLSPKTTGTMVQDQQFVPLSPKRTGNMDNDVGDGTIPKRKRGRPFKTQANSHETSLAVNNPNGDVIPDEVTVTGSVSRKKRSPPSTAEVNVDKVPNRSSGIELSLQQENSKTVKGKRGKPGTLGSIDMESPPPDSQEPSTQKSNGNSETPVEKSLDTVSDDQPLAKWFVGKHSSAAPDSTGKKSSENSKDTPALANGDAPKLSFEKRSQLWGTIEAMEVFRLYPQNPHFRPLDNLKESARERQAINLMVNFSGVFEDMSRLRFGHPRTEIGDHLDTLSQLESHGFDVHRIRKRLNELLSLKDKLEKLATNSKEFKGKIETESVEVKKYDHEIELINKQVKKLKEKRDQITKTKEKKDSELESLKAELEGIKKGMAEARCTFDGLAAASL